MTASELRERIVKSLVSEIDDTQFPSVTMMDRVERVLVDPDDLANYAEVLLKKIEATRYPSISMLDRLDGVLGQLEQAEQRQRLERRARNGSDGD